MSQLDRSPNINWFRWSLTDKKAIITNVILGLCLYSFLAAGAVYFADKGNLTYAIIATVWAPVGPAIFTTFTAILFVQYPQVLPDTRETIEYDSET